MLRSIVVLLLLAPTAHAGEPDGANQARIHFEEGNKLFHLGQFYKAVEEYKLAYRAKPDPSFLYDTAQSLRLANEFNDALFFYRSFLSSGPDPAMRREVEQRVASLERELRAQRKAALDPPTGTVAPSPLAGSALPFSSAATPAPATPAPVAAPAEAALAAPGSIALTDDEPSPMPPRKRRRWWPWAVAGAAAVVVGVALGVGLGVGLNEGAPKAASSIHF